ncbi:NAD(P)H-binding protein [Mycobacterium kyogaense]|uniref:NAD(P)H-binding protein n=1 Tax=Mycobacterium kyogaense TaxID=2212479 RepID=UPI000DAE9C66|nr:NAD(P)H-binding protein [Mycobacterium kyogaense]
MTTILVTGATGNVGRPLVDLLSTHDVRVRAVTRNPTPPFPPGVEAVRDVYAGIAGADAVFLNSRALGPQLDEVVSAARAADVRRLVALSAINVDDDDTRQPSRFRGDRNREAEQAAVDSGLEWVSLRPSVFVTNFLAMWTPQLESGVVAGPFADASLAPIVETDIAAVAVRALLNDDLVGHKILLTGPQALTNTEMVSVIADVTGRRVQYREIEASAVRQRFVDRGFAVEFADAYLAMLADAVGTTATVTDEVQRITGCAATTFAAAVRAAGLGSR